MIPKWPQNDPKMTPKLSQNDAKVTPKWTQSDPKMIPKWPQSDPKVTPKVTPTWPGNDISKYGRLLAPGSWFWFTTQGTRSQGIRTDHTSCDKSVAYKWWRYDGKNSKCYIGGSDQRGLQSIRHLNFQGYYLLGTPGPTPTLGWPIPCSHSFVIDRL